MGIETIGIGVGLEIEVDPEEVTVIETMIVEEEEIEINALRDVLIATRSGILLEIVRNVTFISFSKATKRGLSWWSSSRRRR